MIRFQDSIPTSIYLSQHNSGTAYSWDTIIKDEDLRPVIYIGQGDHACYAMVSFLFLIRPGEDLKNIYETAKANL